MPISPWLEIIAAVAQCFFFISLSASIRKQQARLRSLEDRVEQLAEKDSYLAISIVSIAKRLKDWPLAADMTEGERKMWEDYHRYFRKS